MMPRSVRLWLCLVALVASAPSLSGAAGSSGARRDVSTEIGIVEALVAMGVDPATAVYQRGPRNYAGPDCPGVGWNCVDTQK